ncbi:RluA family pseudouridine synthase [Rubritalea marina]|uniref:RluA family pseudouridine synthase n=1 Tax=Rubritalea marina TaxID=361055 RepID=UPI00035C1FCE|nr:pseudouridine synthase [Rubritalea marina]
MPGDLAGFDSMVEPIEILYRDPYLVAVNKPAGHLVHPAREPAADDLVTMKIVRDQIGQRVYTIHRLDRPTSGVLLLGIDRSVARSLHLALEAHDFEKKYWAVVQGQPAAAEWECRAPIQKEELAPLREAHTSFRVLASERVAALEPIFGEAAGGLSLVEAEPHTGRFHQIRRHLLDCELPIVGDYRYAGIERSNQLSDLLGLQSRMMLQAKSLKIQHPVTGEELMIEAPAEPLFERCVASFF